MALYLRIFLAFWLVILLTLSAVIFLNRQLQQDQDMAAETSQRVQRFADGMGARAQAVLDRAGPTALARWAQADQQRQRRMQLLIIDEQGSEILEKRVPARVRSGVREWRSGQAPPASWGPWAQEITHPQHGRFLVLLVPPSRPLLVRLVGPLGPWGLLGLAAVISGIACLLLARSVTRPVTELRRVGQALGRGRLHERVGEDLALRGDELGDLGRDFNQMAARLERLVGGHRQLLRDVSHELRSPLTRLQMALALAGRAETADDRQRHLLRIEQEIQRLDELIDQILDFSRIRDQSKLARQPIDLVALLGELVESIRLEADARSVQIDLRAPAPFSVPAHREWLWRALENVLRNAVRHSPSGGKIEIKLEKVGGTSEISIMDQGPGVADDQLEAIFEPFVRLSAERSESGAGGGVGLAIAKAAAEHHGGSIRAENRPHGGLLVRLTLPA
ncbi:MAG: ATP-binding protein [Wenzhouxiangella sp.]|jgi:signal transduction histidine kinase|nr:ATP-binding protein [Wenzhouxiangella sp.]